MKNLLNLKGTQNLSKTEQQSINGGWDSNYCQRLFVSADCCHPNWAKCGFPYTGCVNGTCIL